MKNPIPSISTENSRGNIRIFFKAVVIAFLSLMLLIPLFSIESAIWDRARLRDEVILDIARSSTGAQTVIGPIIVIPYTVTHETKRIDPETDKEIVKTYSVSKIKYFLPEELNLNGNISMEKRYRGIYLAHVYQWKGQITGSFGLPANFSAAEGDSKITYKTPYLTLGIKDTRGILYKPELTFNNKPIDFEPGTQYDGLNSGVHAKLSDLKASGDLQVLDFSINVSLQGLQDLKILPLGKTTSIRFTSDWPHPSFNGNQLPLERKVTDNGFTAFWQTTWFANNLGDLFEQSCDSLDLVHKVKDKMIGIKFIEAVDVYQKSERSAKYGFLFIGLTFAAFFLFEIMKRLRIHPIQYGFVGVSLALFFLLEFSLSEHIPFVWAYLIASLSSISVLGYYVAHALKKYRWGIGFASLLGLLYGILYGLLISEDLALMLGSVTLFVLISLVMIFTRNIDWYQMTALPGKTEKNQSDDNPSYADTDQTQ